MNRSAVVFLWDFSAIDILVTDAAGPRDLAVVDAAGVQVIVAA